MKGYVLVLSDKGFRGEREDKSGKKLKELLESIGIKVLNVEILPDEKDLIKKRLIDLSNEDIDVIATTGGTGLTSRDVTPDATLEVIERRIQGMEIAMIMESLKHTPLGSLSRAVVGVRKNTLIINFPGSPKAVVENFKAIEKAIPHAIEKIHDSSEECSRE